MIVERASTLVLDQVRITKASFEAQASGWDVSVALDNRHGARKNLSQENEQ